MSKVKIEGNASGSGTLTISAPNTNTDRSLTLPDGAGEILLANGDGSNLTGISKGVTDAQQWRLSTNRSHNDGEVIGINSGEWEAYDDGNYGSLGSGMSVSATGSESTGGQFTFPSTGIWLITFNTFAQIFTTNGNVGARIQSTYNSGTNWDDATTMLSSQSATEKYNNISGNFIFDVANTSTHRIRFTVDESGGYVTFIGNTNVGKTTATFIRLGDT